MFRERTLGSLGGGDDFDLRPSFRLLVLLPYEARRFARGTKCGLRGSLAEFTGEDTIVIGTGLANRMRVTVGDRISLVSPQGRTTVMGTVPRVRAYEVVYRALGGE